MKRTILLLLAITMLLIPLAACSQKSPPPDPTSSTTEEPTASTQETTNPDGEKNAVQATPLVISEVMPDNCRLTLGREQDWVELYNPTDAPVNLDSYALTDDLENPDALPLTGLTIRDGSYLSIVLEDNGPFGLSETGETVYLTFQGEIISQLTFPAAENGESFDAQGACLFPTPGYANTEEGYLAYLEDMGLPELIISEVMPANGSYYAIRYTEHYDLIEVMNASAAPVSLKDYYLMDQRDSNSRYVFPDIILEPGEFYVVLCSGNPSLGEQHTPFGLTPGETVYLSKQGTLTDVLAIPADLQYDESYGRSGTVPCYLAEPTPGKANSEGYITGIAAPTADIAPGLYDEAVSITLSGEGTIHYTTDGSRPTTWSPVFTEPIAVDDVTTVRAICVSGGRQSPIANFSYVVGKEHDLPVLVISIPDNSMWGVKGILTNVEDSYEYEAVMTLFENGKEAFTTPFGLRLHGNDSRLGPKKNYQLRFRAEYGASKLNYHLFDDRDIDEFDSLLLKGGSEDWGSSMIRDELATSIANGTTALYTQAMKPVVVYMAGEYWGVHHLRERFSDAYVASHMNVSPESVDILYSSDGYVQVGSDDDFDALKSYVLVNNMTTPENYAYLCEQIDVTSLMDWYICRTYMEDTDIANIRRCRSSEGDGKWHWMYFDLDWSFYSRNRTPVTDILDIYGGDRRLIHAVLASEAGQDAFLKRYAYLMRTILNEEYITARIDDIVSSIESEMVRDRPRWYRSVASWEMYVQQVRDFAVDREEIILEDLQNFFALSDQEMEYYFGSLQE